MAPRCKDCKFSRLLPNKGRNGDGHEVSVNLCRRYPPQLEPRGSSFPIVPDDDWCGEFKAMVNPKPAAKPKKRTK